MMIGSTVFIKFPNEKNIHVYASAVIIDIVTENGGGQAFLVNMDDNGKYAAVPFHAVYSRPPKDCPKYEFLDQFGDSFERVLGAVKNHLSGEAVLTEVEIAELLKEIDSWNPEGYENEQQKANSEESAGGTVEGDVP